MADDQEGAPNGPKPQPAPIPDLKKAQENKPAPFAWSPGAPIARAAASASIVVAPGRARPPTALERLNSIPGRLAVLAGLMLLGGAVFTFTALQDGAGGAGGGALGGIKSTIKFQSGRGRDSTGYTKGVDRSNKGQMNFGLIKKGEKDPAPDGTADGAGGVPGAEDDAPMNYDEGSTSRAAGGSAGGAAAAGSGGSDGDGGADAGLGGAPKLNSSYGRIKFQGMRRVSGTAGFRGIKGHSGIPAKRLQPRGPSANSADAASGGAAASRGSALTPFSRDGKREAGGSGAKGAAAGAAAEGGGGGGVGDPGDLEENVEDAKASIPDLMEQARSLRESADKEEKKAKHLAAGGHLPQAHYHYDKAEKKKKKAGEYEAQAARQIDEIKDQAAVLTEP